MYLQDFLKTEEGTKVSKLNKASCTYGFFYNYWRDTLFERIIRLFVWSGVEESGIPVKEIETRLHLRGFCAITKGVKGSNPNNLTAVFADFFGVTKYYDEWENITYHCPVDSGKRKIDKDCVIINNNELRNPTFMLVHHYATLLGHVEVTLINALINVRDAGGVPVVTGEKQKQAAMHYLGKIFNGEYDCIADPSMMGVEYVGADRHTAQPIIDIYQTRERILKSFYNDIGVRTAVEKRANVVTPEITANDGLLQLNISDMLKERQEGAERVNKLYGTNWTVKIADEIQYGKENEPDDNIKSDVPVPKDTETD